jgi:mRNA interferase MazF
MRRPALIVQANSFNESRIATVVIAVVTSNLRLADAPGNVRVSKTDSGLSKPSVVNVSQIFTVDRGVLSERVKTLPQAAMRRVNAGLMLALGL